MWLLGLIAFIAILAGLVFQFGPMVLGKKYPSELPHGGKLFLGGGALGLLIAILNPFYIVEGGHRGVVSNWGAIQNQELGEGLNFVIPIMQKVDPWDVRIFKLETDSSTVSSDTQTITSKSTLNYHADPKMVAEIKQSVGNDYADKIIPQVIQQSLKSITAKYTLIELTSKRNEVRDQVEVLIRNSLIKYHIIVDDYAIVNFEFSDQFEDAIEKKQIASQDVERAQLELQKAQTDAQQQLAKAQAEAAGLKAQREQITSELLELRRIEVNRIQAEKWDGKMPSTVVQSSGGNLLQLPLGGK